MSMVSSGIETDLLAAVKSYLELCPQNLTNSEYKLLERFVELPNEAQLLYQKLYSRRPTTIKIQDITYFEAEKQLLLCKQLEERSLLWISPSWVSTTFLLNIYTVAELKIICKKNNVKSSGNKEILINRIEKIKHRPPLPGLIVKRQSKLFERICITYLRDHDGDISAIQLGRLENVPISFYPITISTAKTIHRNRKEWDMYEFYKRIPPEEVKFNQRFVPVHFTQFRFSGQRFYEKKLFLKAKLLEKENIEQSIEIYHSLLLELSSHHPLSFKCEINKRYALTLHKGRQSRVAVEYLLKVIKGESNLMFRLSLIRTGRKIASSTSAAFLPAPILHKPLERRVHIDNKSIYKNRIHYNNTVIETAVADLISGREVLFSENGPWKMLFSLLFLPCIFNPIDNMLPSPIMRAPIDMYTVGFYKRREQQINEILTKIANGLAPDILRKRELFVGCAIVGVRWDVYCLEQLIELSTKIPNNVITSVMKIFLLHPEVSTRGMPDLFVLPGPVVSVPNAFPRRVTEKFTFIEVKSHNDNVSIYQTIWFHLLSEHNIDVEIWKLKE
jgi:hypothetical protein